MPSIDIQVDGHIGLSPNLLPSMRADAFPQLHQKSIAAGHAPILGILFVSCVWYARHWILDATQQSMNVSAISRFPEVATPADSAPASEQAGQKPETQRESSDEVLLEQVSDGSGEALSALFRRYARVVRGVAYRVLRNASEADDLLQDIFLLVHRLSRTFDSSKGSARFWILQMAYRRAISRRRYLTSRHFYTQVDLDQAANQLYEPNGGSRHPEALMLEFVDRKEALQSWFAELSESQRQTLHLFFFVGYTLEEIATKLDQTVGNARNHYYRGLEKLRKQISTGKLPAKKQYDTRL